MAKWLKLKVNKFLRVIPTFVEVIEEKLVGGPFCRFLSFVTDTYSSNPLGIISNFTSNLSISIASNYGILQEF